MTADNPEPDAEARPTEPFSDEQMYAIRDFLRGKILNESPDDRAFDVLDYERTLAMMATWLAIREKPLEQAKAQADERVRTLTEALRETTKAMAVARDRGFIPTYLLAAWETCLQSGRAALLRADAGQGGEP